MTDTPESDTVATDSPIEEPATPVAAPAEPAPASPPEPPKKDWRDQELGQTRRLLEAERQRVANLEAENRRKEELLEAAQRHRAALANDRAEAPPPPPPSHLLNKDSEEFKAAVRQEAAQMEVQRNAQVLIEKLRSDYPDHEAIANNFQAINDDKGTNSFALLFEVINAADDPAFVTAALGRDPARIRQLVDMTPARRAYAVARIMQERPTVGATPATTGTPKPSDAPPPPSPPPRGGSPNLPTGQVDLMDKRLEFDVQAAQDWSSDQRNRESDAAWYAERERQKKESKGRPWSIGGAGGGRH